MMQVAQAAHSMRVSNGAARPGPAAHAPARVVVVVVRVEHVIERQAAACVRVCTCVCMCACAHVRVCPCARAHVRDLHGGNVHRVSRSTATRRTTHAISPPAFT